MSRWFRFYAEVVNDPKVQKLPCEDFRAWVNLLCLASENGGKIPPLSDVAFSLRMSVDAASTVLERLSSGGLIDRMSGGPDGWHYAPHSWDKRQYKSDTSTDRVKRFRERSENVSETPPETEADTEQKKKDKTTSYPKKRASKRCPGDWYPTHADRSVEARLSSNEVDRQLERFRDHEFPKARSDWSATFRNWLRNAADRKPTNGTPVSPKLDHLDRVSAAMATAGQWDDTERRGDRFDAEPSGGMPLLRSIS